MIVGLIGKPNTGKSTFFNAATLSNVPVGNYPFTTIKPNVGMAYLRVDCVCKELDVKDNPVNSLCMNHIRIIPVELLDVPGLVPDASKGRGLGNKFLDDLRKADALVHVIDVSGSTNYEGRAVPPGSHDPRIDIDFVEKELDLWLAQIIKKDWSRISKTAESSNQKISSALAEKLSGLSITEKQIIGAINDCELINKKPSTWSEDELMNLSKVIRQISKPIVLALNKADLPSSAENIEKLKERGYFVIPCAAEAELLLRKASEKGLTHYVSGDSSFKIVDSDKIKSEQIKALDLVDDRVLKIWKSTGVQKVINAAYFDLLESIVVYPVEDEKKFSDKLGHVLPDAYILRKGSTARDLAFAIHTDLGKTFLYAIDAKRGIRLGAEYICKENDVIKIVSTAKRG